MASVSIRFMRLLIDLLFVHQVQHLSLLCDSGAAERLSPACNFEWSPPVLRSVVLRRVRMSGLRGKQLTGPLGAAWARRAGVIVQPSKVESCSEC